jgi:putative transcriptional regulator
MKTVLSFVPQAVRALLPAMLLSGSALLNATDLSHSHILVATPELRHSIFGSTILVVKAIGGDQHIGFIVNRPADVTLGTIFPEHGPSQKITDPVYFGGPVGAEWIFALVHRYDSPPGNSFELLPGLYLVAEAADVDRVIEREADRARFVAGLVVWRAGELAKEVQAGAWYVLEPNAEVVMRRPEGLWEELVQRSRVAGRAI